MEAIAKARGWTGRRNVSEEESPAMRFGTRAEAEAAAKQITDAPNSGVARALYTGAWDCWLVDVHPRDNPYGNAYTLRADGTVANYH